VPRDLFRAPRESPRRTRVARRLAACAARLRARARWGLYAWKCPGPPWWTSVPFAPRRDACAVRPSCGRREHALNAKGQPGAGRTHLWRHGAPRRREYQRSAC